MIYIITPCSRPQNLNIISKSIPEECTWIIVHDDKHEMPTIDNATFFSCDDTGYVGTKARNYALDNLKLEDEDLIYFLDDDNIIHEDWYKKISPLIDNDFSIMTWGQINKDNTARLKPTDKPQAGNIDTASFLIRWKYNKNVRHKEIYAHDGIYAKICLNNGPILHINEYLCYYNYLR